MKYYTWYLAHGIASTVSSRPSIASHQGRLGSVFRRTAACATLLPAIFLGTRWKETMMNETVKDEELNNMLFNYPDRYSQEPMIPIRIDLSQMVSSGQT
jgi:hypothetical protein